MGGYRLLADAVVFLHLAFILFAVAGGLLWFWWPRAVWVHLPAALWAVGVELAGWSCPLTPLEGWLRRAGGASGYDASFVEQYLVPVIYPEALTRELQLALGFSVVVVNAGIYAWCWRARRRR